MRELGRSHSRRWLEALDHLRRWINAKPRLPKLIEAIILGTVLLAPSVWMLSVIPPLWRDSDAYVQLTEPPGFQTIVHWGPLYCFGARIPLYVGYAIECLGTGKPFPSPVFFIHPTLNDSGVFLLLLSQHVALVCSSFYFIILTTRLFWVRLGLAAVWASNPLFYTFAHCVGSETLSVILLVLMGAAGLRIVQRSRNVPWKEWLFFGVLLWVCILARHINAVLAAAMPLTFLLLCGYRLVAISLGRSQLRLRSRRLRMRQELKQAAVAVVVGVISIVLANVSLRSLCRLAHIPYYSPLGITFATRLDFLARLSPEKRDQLLDEIARNSSLMDVKKTVPLLRESFSNEAENWDTMLAYLIKKDAEKALPLAREAFPHQSPGDTVFLPRAAAVFRGQGPSLLVVLNHIAKAFLFPPRKVYLNAVVEDFRRSLCTTIENVVNNLFLTTTFYYLRTEQLPGYASLQTYRNSSANQIVTNLEKHRYFHFWKGLDYAVFLCLWIVNLVLLAVLMQIRKKSIAVVVSYAVALTLVGLLMMLATCVLSGFQPRFTLPIWEVTILSASVLFVKTMECCFSLTASA